MHHIQKSIILNLARTAPLRFSELQPPRVPNNTFSYHLKKLVEGGYVELTGSGYVATRKALKIIAYGISTNRSPSTPKIISMIYIENTDGEVLLINRNYKPFHGWYCLPSGLMHEGETLDEAAHREVIEKTTIDPGDLRRVGALDIRYINQQSHDIFMHTVAFIFRCQFTGDKQALSDKVTRYGQLVWSKLGRENILPEVYTVKQLIDKGAFSYESVCFEEPAQKLVRIFDSKDATESPAVKYIYLLAIHGLHSQIINPRSWQDMGLHL